MKILTELGYIDAVAVFFELTDEQLERVKKDVLYYTNKDLIKEFTEAKGDNAHFIGLCNNGEGSLISKKLTMLLKDYKSVSWWDKDMQKFIIKRS